MCRRRPLAVLTLAALALAALAAGPASAAPAAPRILSPADRATIIGPTITVRVRVAPGVGGFRASVNGRSVGARFGRPTNGVRTAVLRRGRDFAAGPVRILVASGKPHTRSRSTDSVGLVSARRSNRQLTVTRATLAAGGSAVRVKVRSPRRLERTTVALNGRRVTTGLRPHRDGRGLDVLIGGDEGLRFGSNTVVVATRHTGALVARRELTFDVPRTAPLVGAGPDRRTTTGRPVTLDGSSSRPAGAGSLRYRWRLVTRPKGSRARITGAATAKARFVPDQPGTYHAQLAVTGGVGRPSASPTLQQKLVPLSAIDRVRVTVAPGPSPLSLPIQTITDAGGIAIGTQTYPRAGSWVQMLVLDPLTAQPTAGPWGSGTKGYDPGDGGRLLSDARSTTTSQLVVLSGQGLAQPASMDAKNLGAAIEALGGTTENYGPTPGGAKDLAVGSWSLIGHAGLGQGQAYQSFAVTQAGLSGLNGGDPGGLGSLNGYLQPVTNNAYQFVPPEFSAIDTKAQGSSATTNIITVGSASHPSATVPSGALAAQVVVLDSSTGFTPLEQGTFVLNNPDGSTVEGDAGSGVRGLATMLQKWNGRVADHVFAPPLVILQTFGSPTYAGTVPQSAYWVNDRLPSMANNTSWYGGVFPNDPQSAFANWNPGYPTVAGQVGQLAGLEYHDTVANFGRGYRTQGGITVVASTHLWSWESAFAQGQTDPVASQGRAVGTLVRNRQSQWSLAAPAWVSGWSSTAPSAAGQTSLDMTELWEIAFGDPVAWPLSGTPAYAAASANIALQMGWPDLTDVRQAYVEKSSDFTDDGDGLQERLRFDVSYPGEGRGFSAADFAALKAQLLTEFEDVTEVRTGIDNWQGIFVTTGAAGTINLQTIADGVYDEVVKAEDEIRNRSAGIDGSAVAGDLMLVASAVVAVVAPESLGFAAATLGGFSALLALADAYTATDSAEPDTGRVIWAEAYMLGQELADRNARVVATLDHLGDVFVSDWAKLQTTGDRFNDQWAFSTKDTNTSIQSMAVAAERTLFTGLAPLAYEQWVISPRFSDDNGLGPLDPPTSYQCRYAKKSNLGTWIFDGYDNPFTNAPAGSVTSVVYRPGSGPDVTRPPAEPLTTSTTGRGLKVVGSLVPQAVPPDHIGLNHAGDSPEAALIDRLFQPVTPTDPTPSDPSGLGMSKDVFFGAPTWSMRKLQCGPNAG